MEPIQEAIEEHQDILRIVCGIDDIILDPREKLNKKSIWVYS